MCIKHNVYTAAVYQNQRHDAMQHVCWTGEVTSQPGESSWRSSLIRLTVEDLYTGL